MISREEYLTMYHVVGAIIDVFNELGRGMEEPIYQESLEMELNNRNIPFEREKPLHLKYKGQVLKKTYFADFYSQGIMIELKSVERLCSEHRAQLFNYMRISQTCKGLLVNFGERSLRVERYLYDRDRDDFILLSKSNLNKYVETKENISD